MKTKQNLLVALAVVIALITGYSLKPEPALAQESSNGYICFKLDSGSGKSEDSAFALISTNQKTIMIYKVKYQKGKKTSLELDATRSFKFDEQLEEWKTEPKLSILEAQIKKMAAKRK